MLEETIQITLKSTQSLIQVQDSMYLWLSHLYSFIIPLSHFLIISSFKNLLLIHSWTRCLNYCEPQHARLMLATFFAGFPDSNVQATSS
jgi:hypothetical protein